MNMTSCHINSHVTFYVVSCLCRGVFRNPILSSCSRPCSLSGAGTVIYGLKPATLRFCQPETSPSSVHQATVHSKSTHVSAQLYILSVALNIFIITGVL